MKNWKIFFFMTIGIAVLLIGSNTALAGENTRAGISIDFDDNHMGDNGQTIVTGVGTSQDVSFELHCTNVSNFAAFTVKIAFDTTKLTYKSVSLDNATTGENNFLKSAGGDVLTFPAPKVVDGVLELNVLILPANETNSPEGSGLLGFVTFTTASTAIVDANLAFSSVKYYDAAAAGDKINLIHTNVIGGSINPSDAVAPSPITDLTADTTVEGNLRLSWTNPGNNNVAIFKYSTSPITQGNWDEATTLIHSDFETEQTPNPSLGVGILKTQFVDTSYYFAMKTMDLTPNVSIVSNNARLSFVYYSISGVVGLADNPADLSGSIVTLNGMADTTDISGAYYISPVEPGTYTVSASHEGYQDKDTSVNVTQSMVIDFVLLPSIEDVATLDIVLPPETVYCDSTYAVRAKVANLGYLPATFDVYLGIVYYDNVTVHADTEYNVSLAMGETTFVDFKKEWQVPSTDSITYSVYVTAYYEDDDSLYNNALRKDVFSYCLAYPDVGPISIESPPDVVTGGVTYPVEVTVKNFGNVAATFDVSCTIDSYADTQGVVGLAPGDSTSVEFEDWAPSTHGYYPMTVITHLVDDTDITNDTLQQVISVLAPPSAIINEIYYDEPSADKYTFTELKGEAGTSLDNTYLLGISGITGTVNATIALTGRSIPAADNYFVVGQDPLVDNVDMVNSAVNWPNDTYNVWFIYAFEGDTIILDKVGYGPTSGWIFKGEGNPASDVDPGHSIARYPDGQDTDDNSVDFEDFPVPTPGLPNMWSDVAVDTIMSVPDLIVCGDKINPKAIVKNEGEKEETFDVVCAIEGTEYQDEKSLTLGVGGSSTLEFAEFTVPACDDTIDYRLTVHAYLATDMDTTNNRKEKTFEAVGVEEQVGLPSAFALLQNNPNPLVRLTKIAYQLPAKCKVSLTIYDATGRLVRTLVDRLEDAGYKSAIWNGKDDEGDDVASGIYFYKLEAGNHIAQKKMILIR